MKATIKLEPMFDNWGAFKLNPNFTAKYKYNEKLLVSNKIVINIPEVAKKTRVKNENIIKFSIANNIAIPRQPKDQEGKIRGKSGEYLFEALISGAIDMNDIKFDHDGWDFEIEHSGCRVEVKTTAPEGGKPGNANLSQGDRPDVYVIFKFNNMGKFQAVYLIPVDVMRDRTEKVPKTLKITDGSWVSNFEITLNELQLFFNLATYYYWVYNGAVIQNDNKLGSMYTLNRFACKSSCCSNKINVKYLFEYATEWWKIYLRLRASAILQNIPIKWCWNHI